MTETLISLSSARGIRMRCQCGAEATVPVSALHAPASCFNCSEPWPDKAVKELCRLLGWIQKGGEGGIKIELVLIGKE